MDRAQATRGRKRHWNRCVYGSTQRRSSADRIDQHRWSAIGHHTGVEPNSAASASPVAATSAPSARLHLYSLAIERQRAVARRRQLCQRLDDERLQVDSCEQRRVADRCTRFGDRRRQGRVSLPPQSRRSANGYAHNRGSHIHGHSRRIQRFAAMNAVECLLLGDAAGGEACRGSLCERLDQTSRVTIGCCFATCSIAGVGVRNILDRQHRPHPRQVLVRLVLTG